jgi:hypothetical protein
MLKIVENTFACDKYLDVFGIVFEDGSIGFRTTIQKVVYKDEAQTEFDEVRMVFNYYDWEGNKIEEKPVKEKTELGVISKEFIFSNNKLVINEELDNIELYTVFQKDDCYGYVTEVLKDDKFDCFIIKKGMQQPIRLERSEIEPIGKLDREFVLIQTMGEF